MYLQVNYQLHLFLWMKTTVNGEKEITCPQYEW